MNLKRYTKSIAGLVLVVGILMLACGGGGGNPSFEEFVSENPIPLDAAQAQSYINALNHFNSHLQAVFNYAVGLWGENRTIQCPGGGVVEATTEGNETVLNFRGCDNLTQDGSFANGEIAITCNDPDADNLPNQAVVTILNLFNTVVMAGDAQGRDSAMDWFPGTIYDISGQNGTNILNQSNLLQIDLEVDGNFNVVYENISGSLRAVDFTESITQTATEASQDISGVFGVTGLLCGNTEEYVADIDTPILVVTPAGDTFPNAGTHTFGSDFTAEFSENNLRLTLLEDGSFTDLTPDDAGEFGDCTQGQ